MGNRGPQKGSTYEHVIEPYMPPITSASQLNDGGVERLAEAIMNKLALDYKYLLNHPTGRRAETIEKRLPPINRFEHYICTDYFIGCLFAVADIEATVWLETMRHRYGGNNDSKTIHA